MSSTVEDKKHIDKLFANVSALERKDIVILEDLARQGAASKVELAAHLVLLPSDVNECLERLSDFGFIESAPAKKTHVGMNTVRLSAQGKEAAGLLPFVEKIKGWVA